MKIEISKTQYKTLVKALFLANWVVNANKEEWPDDEFEKLEQYAWMVSAENRKPSAAR